MTPIPPSIAARCHRIAIVIGAGAAVSLVSAQPAPTPSASADDLAKYDTNRNGVLDVNELAARAADQTAATKSADDAVVLSPFEVSTNKDRGYFGGSTLAGGRADTPIKFTPASISVMTKEFMEDFDLTDMNQALAWTVGADAPTGGEAGAFGGNRFQTSFRGVDGNGNFPVRNGSINYYVADSYNSERYDFSRGPNAALFGDGGPGGLQGSTSKKARYRSTDVETSARIDTFGSYRGTADLNYGVERIAFRLNLLHQNTKGWQDGTSSKQNGLTLAARFRITDKTEISTEVQRDGEKNIAYRKVYAEQASRWNRTTVNNNNTAIPDFATAGLAQFSATTDYLLWNFGTNNLLNYSGDQYQTIGFGYPIPWQGRQDIPNFVPGVSKEFFLGPADAIIDRDFNAQSFWLDHVFSRNLAVQFGIVKNDGDPYYINTQDVPNEYRIDVNRLLPNGQINPNFGKAFSDFDQSFQYQQDRVREYKFSGVYTFKVQRALDLDQRFNLNAGWRRTTFEALNSSWRRTNNPNPAFADPLNAANLLHYRVYWDSPRPSVEGLAPPSAPGYEWRLAETGGNINERTITYAQLVSQSTFLNERVAVTASFRRDKVEGDFFNRLRTDPVTLKNVGGFNGVDGAHLKRKRWQNSPNGGVVVYPFVGMNKWLAPLGFMANYSSNFTQISSATTPLISGDEPPLTNSETKDWGVRYAMGDGDAYVTVTHYNTTQENQLGTWGTRTQFQALYAALGYTDPVFTGSTGFNYQDVSSRKLEGWEAEFMANPTQNISLSINYSHPIVKTVFDSRDRRAFFEANRGYYQRAAAAAVGQVVDGVAVSSPTAVATNVQAIEDSLNGTTAGTLGNNLERHRVNVAGSYRFREGRLTGLGFSGGFNYRGHKKVGSRDARLKFQTVNPTVQQTAEAAYDYLWVAPTWQTTAGVNYTRRFGKYTARFQINITNLLNDDDPLWGSYAVIQAGAFQNLPAAQTQNGNALTVPGGNPRMQVLTGNANNFVQEPRKISFTTTLRF